MQPTKTPKTRYNYDRTGKPADLRTEVFKMLDSGQTAAYIANAPGVSENLICRWKSEASPGVNQVGKKVVAGQTELTVENRQLSRRVELMRHFPKVG
jgi:transposase